MKSAAGRDESHHIVLATGYHARARPLWEGRVETGNLQLGVVPFRNDGERHQRFLDGEFDAAEFSLALYLTLKGRGASFIALPVFPNRKFRYSSIYVRRDSSLARPEDLKGKTVGVPSFLNTCGVWVRGLLRDEYGVKVRDICWQSLRKEPVDFIPPEGTVIEQMSGRGDLASRLLNGEVDAVITPDILDQEGIRRLFSAPKEAEKDYYRRTGIFPISHAVVIRQEVLSKYPDLARKLFHAWETAKKLSLEDDADPTYSNFAWIRNLWEEETALFGPDPWGYGIAGNEKALEALLRYASEQGLIKGRVSPEDFFIPMERV